MVTEDGFFKYPKFRGKGVEKEPGKKKKKRNLLEVLQATSRLSDSLERLTECIIFTITVYYYERIQSKISKWKGSHDKVQKKLGTNFQEFFPNGITLDTT